MIKTKARSAFHNVIKIIKRIKQTKEIQGMKVATIVLHLIDQAKQKREYHTHLEENVKNINIQEAKANKFNINNHKGKLEAFEISRYKKRIE